MTQTITRERITEVIDRNEPVTIIEALPKKYYDSMHLPNAINIPHDEIRQKATNQLSDLNKLIVVYCASTECQNSKIATNLLIQMGYKNAFEYVEGKKDWVEAGLPTESST